MTPLEFFADHGLIVETPIDDGRWHRVPTTDHPRTRNGAYKIDGPLVVCQNWALDEHAVSMRDESAAPDTHKRHAAEDRARRVAQEQGYKRAAERARIMLGTANVAQSGYMARKGFEGAQGLVLPDGALFVPMYAYGTPNLAGAQIIRWLPDEMRWEKKFLPGMRAKGAVFTIGHQAARDTVLVEGLATGMSVDAAANLMHLSMRVIVTFSDGNLVYVATLLPKDRPAFVFADSDANGAGQRAAVKTGLPWAMSDVCGNDANDDHQQFGLMALAGKVMQMRRMQCSRAEQTPDIC